MGYYYHLIIILFYLFIFKIGKNSSNFMLILKGIS